MSSDVMDAVGIGEILRHLPHRYPFLMVDRVLEIVPGERCVAIKNVTVNEPYFQGHFPELPIMPGVLQLEAMAQAGGILLGRTEGSTFDGKLFMFTGMEKVRFRKPVVPGDQLRLEISDMRRKMNLIKMSGRATVEGKVACQAELTAAIVDRETLA